MPHASHTILFVFLVGLLLLGLAASSSATRPLPNVSTLDPTADVRVDSVDDGAGTWHGDTVIHENTTSTHRYFGTSLPQVKDWPHRPVFLKAGSDMSIFGIPHDQGVPLGIPFDFETPLFKGRMIVRFRHAPSKDSVADEAYFSANDGKHLMQLVVQGSFKRRVRMDELYVGGSFSERFRMVPPPTVMRMLKKIFRRAAPGIILDMATNQPKIISLFAGTAQSISMDRAGEEPDITAIELLENLGKQIGNGLLNDIPKRKKFLSMPEHAQNYYFDIDHVYTLNIFDHNMDLGRFSIKIPLFGDFCLSKVVGPQPMSLIAMAASTGEFMFHFDVWHEQVYRKKFEKTSFQ